MNRLMHFMNAWLTRRLTANVQKAMSHFINPDDIAGEVSKLLLDLTLVILSRPEAVMAILTHESPLKRYVGRPGQS